MLKMNCLPLAAGLLLSTAAPRAATAKDYLRACWHQQGEPLQANCLVLRYRETVHELEHNAAPWQTTAYAGRGTVWSNADSFLKQDTLQPAAKPRTYFSSTQWSPATLLFRDYGDKDLFAATSGLQQDYTFRSARYSPVALLAYFVQQHISADKTAPPGLVAYHATINETVVSLFIRKRDALLDHITLLSPDELLGDVTWEACTHSAIRQRLDGDEDVCWAAATEAGHSAQQLLLHLFVNCTISGVMVNIPGY